MQVGAILQVADADHRAESVPGEALEMIDQVLARVIFLRHRAVDIVLEADMAVEIDLAGHDGFASQVDVCRAGGDLQFAALAYLSELAVLDDEGGVFDGWAVVARDEPCAFKYGYAGVAWALGE